MKNKIFTKGDTNGWNVYVSDELNGRICLNCGKPCYTSILFTNEKISAPWHFTCWIYEMQKSCNVNLTGSVEAVLSFLKENSLADVLLED